MPNRKPDVNEVFATPVGFCEGILGYPKLYGWQCDAINPFLLSTGPKAQMIQVAVMSPNEGGRSSLIVSGVASWWLALHKRGKVGITTADQKQLNEQIIPALEVNVKKMGWHSVMSPYYRITTDDGGRLIAFTTDDAGRVEGLHKGDDIEAPLLWIIDESKNVKEPIFTGVDRCSYNAKLLSSSPGLKHGTFFKAFTEHREQYICIQAGLKDCPHISRDKVDRIISTYGIDHPFTRSSVFGEFMDQDEVDRYILSDTDLQRCIQNPPPFKPGFVWVFCDFGGGHDENVIVKRDGNKIDIVASWREANKEAAAGRFIRHFVELKVRPNQISGDASDKEILDLIARGGWNIGRQNFGHRLPHDPIYTSWGARAWMEGAASIARCEWILPREDGLFAELTTRQKALNASGKWQAEEKYEMRKRGVPSPNKADAVFGCMAAVDYTVFDKVIDFSNWRDQSRDLAYHRVLEEAGASAGTT
jgi:hypothetical protein